VDIVLARTCGVKPARHGMLADSEHFEFRRFWGWGWEEVRRRWMLLMYAIRYHENYLIYILEYVTKLVYTLK
jgi:hypothetical protein